MDFGIAIFPTDTTLQPVELAQRVEALGFSSLWFSEHSHIPTSRRTPAGGVAGAKPLPEKYWRTHDAFVALTAAAVTTERLRLGTGITLLAQRDPIWTAKEVASLDVISGGRLTFGIGYGWNIEEMESHGVDYSKRRELLREKLLLMKALWIEEEASFDGDMIRLEPSWAWPKPVQKPHPPVILGGGAGPKTVDHLVEFCDGWMPLGRHELGDKVRQVRNAVEASGRDPDAFRLVYFGAQPTEEMIERLTGHRFDEVLFSVDSDPPGRVRERLEELSSFTGQYIR